MAANKQKEHRQNKVIFTAEIHFQKVTFKIGSFPTKLHSTTRKQALYRRTSTLHACIAPINILCLDHKKVCYL